MYDIIIIGAGVTGAACARAFSKYQLKVCVIEKEEDVCSGTSKANSGIIHAGFDAEVGSLMAEMNVAGNGMMSKLAEELNIPFRRNGSLVVGKEKDSVVALKELYERGIMNGVKDLELIYDKERIFQMEPNLAEEVEAVLYAPSAGIICPFELNLAMAEHAKINGVEFQFNTTVLNLESVSSLDGGIEKNYWKLETNQGEFQAQYVINGAGVYADKFHNMVSKTPIKIIPRKGEYLLLDKQAGNHVSHTIFALPTKLGKGILVTPTVHGNLLIGPTAEDIENKEGSGTSSQGLQEIIEKATSEGFMNVRNVPLRQVITSFAGLRAHEEHHEFIIKELEDAQGFIDCAGIESPGLTSSPAIGEKVLEIVSKKLTLVEKDDYCKTRSGFTRMDQMDKEERKQFIQEHPAYGNIICRCEMISEGEILEAIHRPLGGKSLDGIKRRVRATSGRCQGGFCGPKVMEILSRELGIDPLHITKSGGQSNLLVGVNKETIEV